MSGQSKTKLMNFRASPHLADLVRSTAEMERLSVSEWLRRLALRRAAEVATGEHNTGTAA
jgi:uncharacterized protein (DUF1778 family)